MGSSLNDHLWRWLHTRPSAWHEDKELGRVQYPPSLCSQPDEAEAQAAEGDVTGWEGMWGEQQACVLWEG